MFDANIKEVSRNKDAHTEVKQSILSQSDAISAIERNELTSCSEGARTIFYDIFNQFKKHQPDVIVTPGNDSILIIALWKAYRKFKEMIYMTLRQIYRFLIVGCLRSPDRSLLIEKLD